MLLESIALPSITCQLQPELTCCLQVLEKHVRNLLNLAVVLLFPDGLQMMMAGIFQVCATPDC